MPDASEAMICILSQAFLESTTEAVGDWLRSWGVPFIRINADDIECDGCCTIRMDCRDVTVSLTLDGVPVDLNHVGAVWYRRWDSSRGVHVNSQDGTRGRIFARQSDETRFNTLASYRHVSGEFRVVSDFLFSRLEFARWLGSPSTSDINKLKVLALAAAAGLDIPATLVTGDVAELQEFAERESPLITKPLSGFLLCRVDDSLYGSYTSAVPDTFVSNSSWRGGYASLFQERLDKQYEIRTFYLDGTFYSMAMFTQRHLATQVDFRHYHVPIRCVPYELPPTLEGALRSLMNSLKLDTGSLDLVRTVNGRFVFLEVNPIGQFGMVSGPCNYRLEEKVAKALVERASQNEHADGRQ